MASVNSPSSAIGIARGGKAPSRILPVEGDQLRAVGPQPRSESTGEATTSPGGDPPRRRGQIRESGDVGRRGTPGREPELVAVESGKHLHHPDEGRPEFTNLACRVTSTKLSPLPTFVKIGQRVLAWQWVEFWPFPLTCVVVFTYDTQYRASVRSV